MTILPDQLNNFKVRAAGYTSPCWIWDGRKNPRGYGVSPYGPRHGLSALAHRAIYQILRGPIHNNLTLDHLCCVKDCVNPDHLEPVTSEENLRRGHANGLFPSPPTTCAQGHHYSEENTSIYRYGDKIWRRCKACSTRWAREYQRRKRMRDKGAINPPTDRPSDALGRSGIKDHFREAGK
jgi:hypothetical protein